MILYNKILGHFHNVPILRTLATTSYDSYGGDHYNDEFTISELIKGDIQKMKNASFKTTLQISDKTNSFHLYQSERQVSPIARLLKFKAQH